MLCSFVTILHEYPIPPEYGESSYEPNSELIGKSWNSIHASVIQVDFREDCAQKAA